MILIILLRQIFTYTRRWGDMHVLILPSWYPSCPDDLSGSFFREQALALAQIGAKVGVIAPTLRSLQSPPKSLFYAGRLYKEVDNNVCTYRASILHLTPGFWKATVRRVAGLAERILSEYLSDCGRPDVVHVHSALPAGQGAINIASKLNVPLFYSEHSTAFARDLLGRGGLEVASNLVSKADHSFAVSKPFATLMEQKLALTAGSIKVMPNPVHASFLAHDIATPVDGCVRFLHISMLDSKKNVAVLLEAFSTALICGHDIKLTIGGDGPTRPMLEQLAKMLGIEEKVSFIGKLSRADVVAALAEADVFVLSSKFETFGVVVVEALAMGVPVIATRCGGPEDIIEKGDGLLVPVDDVNALANAMIRLVQSSPTANRLARRQRCRERFGSEGIAARWLELYGKAVADREASPST
jgi:glycosyltransferase involved in cell wall biosynthesis